MGVDRHEVFPTEDARIFPLFETEGVLSAIWSPDDGRANPVAVTMSMAARVRKRGVRIGEGSRVTDFIVKNRHVQGVMTAQSPIMPEVVVLAAGMWSRWFAVKIGVSEPLQAAEH